MKLLNKVIYWIVVVSLGITAIHSWIGFIDDPENLFPAVLFTGLTLFALVLKEEFTKFPTKS